VWPEAEADERAIRYLLGELSPEERDQFEDRYFSDAALHEQLQAIEEELIDSYVRGELSSEQRTHFEQRFLQSPERREKCDFAKALAELQTAASVSAHESPEFLAPEAPPRHANLAEPARSAPPRKSPMFPFRFLSQPGLFRKLSIALALGIAPALAVVIGLAILPRHVPQQRAKGVASYSPDQKITPVPEDPGVVAHAENLIKGTASNLKEEAKRQSSASASTDSLAVSYPASVPARRAPASVLSFVLVPVERAATSQPPSVNLAKPGALAGNMIPIPPGAYTINLQMNVSSGDYESYSATLQNVGTSRTASRSGLKLTAGADSGKSVIASFPSTDLPPGEYILRLDGITNDGSIEAVDGYTFRVPNVTVRPITTAHLVVSGGTPGAQVWLDGAPIGLLVSNGSFGYSALEPDIDHSIQFKKRYFEDSPVLHERAPVSQIIWISGWEAVLKPFGTLALTVTPPQAQVTIQRRGEAQSTPIADKTIQLREGTYTVRGTAGDQYSPYQQDVQIISGKQTPIQVRLGSLLTALEKTPTNPPSDLPTPPRLEQKAPPPVVQLTDLFRGDPKHWQRDQQGFPRAFTSGTGNYTGFWTHDGLVWFKDAYFVRTFEVFLKKGTFGAAKLQWRTFLDADGNDYFEFELSDKELKKREVVDKKAKDWEKPKPHGIAQGGPYVLRIAIKPDQIENSIGQVTDIINRKVQGATGFDGKVDLKLIQ
jgi:anti-sigma factor RsiW